MSKILFIIYKKEGLTHDKCLQEWKGTQHHSVVSKVPGLIKWMQNHTLELPNENAPNGIGELWFESTEALESAMQSPEMGAAVEDAKRFLDMERTYAIVVREESMI